MSARLKILTLNVCFEQPDTYQFRFPAIVGFIQEQSFDVVALQEVVPPLFQRLEGTLSRTYDISPITSSSVYFTVLLCKKPLQARFSRFPLQSRMGRDLLLADVKTGTDATITCGTVHLESEDSHPVRETQMRQINDRLKDKPNVVLMGDFNFPAHRNYRPLARGDRLHNESISECLPSFIDVWAAKYPSAPGYTFDHSRNQWKFPDLLKARGGFRFDRVLSKLLYGITVDKLTITAHDAVMTLEAENSRPACKMYMSDHLGLSFELIINPVASTDGPVATGNSCPSKRQRLYDDESGDDDIVIVEPKDKDAKKELTRAAMKDSERIQLLNTLLGPEPGEADVDTVKVGLISSNGRKFARRFHLDSAIEVLLWWAIATDSTLSDESVHYQLRRCDDSSQYLSPDNNVENETPLRSLEHLHGSLWRVVRF